MLLRSLEALHPRSLRRTTYTLRGLVDNRLWLQVIVGMVLGITVGMLLGPTVGLVEESSARMIGSWLALPGRVFLGLIQMIVVPLVFASIICGLAASDSVEQLRRTGLQAVAFFLVTTVIAVCIGLAAALLIRPGQFIDTALVQAAAPVAAGEAPDLTTPALSDVPELLVGLLPMNPLGSMVEREMLQVVVFAIIAGVALVTMRAEQSKPLISLLTSLQEVCMTVVRWAMYLAPLAVFGLLAELTTRIGLEAILGMSVYVATVILGLVTLMLLYGVIVIVGTRTSPLSFLVKARDTLLLAFSTSSSAAVMPLSIQTAESKLGVRSSVAQFVIPLGATINMTGTALYQAVAALFLAQVYGVELSMAGMLLILVTTVGASIGSPATPGVGIVILAMVLTSVGIPTAGIALILGVDRILDMCRTAVNVMGDLVACMILDRWAGSEAPVAVDSATEGDFGGPEAAPTG
jgi:Na+/H+-dicarboxylate symporter